MKLSEHIKEISGYSVKIELFQDCDMAAPWIEHDGHGLVHGWERRDKRPGEYILATDRNAKLFYDFAGTLAIARREGWGLSEESAAALESKLGRKATAAELIAESVRLDFEYCREFATGVRYWVGYKSQITCPQGNPVEFEGDSVWGFDSEEFAMQEAESAAKWAIAKHAAEVCFEQNESFAMACRDVATV